MCNNDKFLRYKSWWYQIYIIIKIDGLLLSSAILHKSYINLMRPARSAV